MDNTKIKEKEPFFTAKTVAKIGIFTALSCVLYLFVNIPLPFLFPAFLKLNVSDFPALICGFALGPTAGVIVVVIKCLIKLLVSGAESMGAGELSDLINGLAFVVVSAIIYKRNKCKKTAIIGIILGAIASVITSILSNRFLIIPYYITIGGMSMDILVKACSIIPNITAENFYTYYILFAVVPFNVLRCLFVGLTTFFTYKHISKLLHKM